MPNASEVQIMNRAIGLIGGDRITDPDNGYNGRTSRVIDLFETVYLEALTIWPWANARARLLLPAEDETPAWGFSYQYVLPTEALAVQAACTQGQVWEVEGGKLLTDAAGPLKVLATTRLDPSRLHPLIAYYTACRLALAAVMAQSESTTLQERVRGFVQDAFLEAVNADNAQGSALPLVSSGWVLGMQTGYAPELQGVGTAAAQSSWLGY